MSDVVNGHWSLLHPSSLVPFVPSHLLQRRDVLLPRHHNLRKVLQKLQQLDLQPRAGSPIVHIVRRRLLFKGEGLEDVDHVGDHGGVFGGVLGG